MRDQKGITLVALILIIVILVVLAGISVTLVFKNETEKERANKPQPEQKSQQEIYEEYEHLLNQNIVAESTITDSIARDTDTTNSVEMEISSDEKVISSDESNTVDDGIITKVSNTAGNYLVENIDMNTVANSGTNTTSGYNPSQQ